MRVLVFLIIGLFNYASCNEKTTGLAQQVDQLKKTQQYYEDVVADIRVVMDGDKKQIEEQKQVIDRLIAENRMLKGTPRAGEPFGFFHSVLTTDRNGMGSTQTIVFDSAPYNPRGDFDVTYGDFTAPISGTYLFYATLITQAGQASYAFEIVKTGAVQALAHTGRDSSNNVQSGSAQVLVHCTAGERVAVRVANGFSNVSVGGGNYSSFGGFLLHNDPIY
eukprot:GHVU01136675.1.p1 GENE.GHVU01136675.1~~GHVU01136675.1.p1  ORF type:complete len:220 (+),score=22.66 GHVU01136675.1:28-687(+)